MADPAGSFLTGEESVVDEPNINEEALKEYLTRHGWPIGLQEATLKSFYKIPMRYFIIDDSGSMKTQDGHRLVNDRVISCSRWQELVDSMRFHVGLAHAANAATEFRLLNGAPPCMVGVGDDDEGYHQIIEALRHQPRGGTPLCRHIREIVAEIQAREKEIRAADQVVAVIIATDGRSSDGDIVEELRPMEQLPVQIVVRLCTDDDSIVEYWNGIDTELDADLDVLDDLFGEAAEVYEHNKWLTYGEPIHKLREFGIDVKEFDLLDEEMLSMDQVRTMCAAILGGDPDSYPHPLTESQAFLRKIDGLNKALGTVFSPMKLVRRPWVEDCFEILIYLNSVSDWRMDKYGRELKDGEE